MEQPIYLSEKALARKWGISHRTLQRWRWLNQGPTYLKIGGRVRYTQEAIQAFEDDRSYSPEQQEKMTLDHSSSLPNQTEVR